MRYRFISGQFAGHHDDVLVFEEDDAVFRYQMTRLSYAPLPAAHLEDVTAAMAGIEGPAVLHAIQTAAKDEDPADIYRAGLHTHR
jgi:hypothetical protein